MADSLARAVILFSLRPDGLESDVTTLDASARRMHAAVCGARARMPPRNIRKKRRDSDDEERDGVEDDESTAEALERARAAQAARSRAKGLHVETLISGKRAEHVKPADADGTVDVPPPPGAAGIALGQLSKETRMIGTNSAFASAGVVLAGQELVKDGDVGGGEGDGYGLRTAEEARARAYVEEELRRRRGELTGDAEAGESGAADAGAGGDDNRGAESWLTAIEEVDVAPELKIRNIEETERMKRAMLDGAVPGEAGAFDTLKPTHIEVKETKKRPPPSENALARRQFVTGFGNKRERQEATESSKRDKERRKKFFKKKRHKK